MKQGAGLVWMWRRLGRMPVAEIGYRVIEQIRRMRDRVRRPGWEAFGRFPGSVDGLPGVGAEQNQPAPETLSQTAEDYLAGRFTLLGRSWPEPDQETPWWAGEAWLTDPVSAKRWPGRERFAFDAPYRGRADLGDVKFVWELNRLQMLPLLALHARSQGADGAAVFDVLQGWMDANPPFRGVNWISGIEAASRLVSLLAALSVVRPTTQVQRAAVRAFVDAHALWIARYPSRFSSANNHRLAELTALLLVGLCAPGRPGAVRLWKAARADLEREARRQIHPDGVGAEQSVAYAAYSLEWLTVAGWAAEAAGCGFSGGYRARIRAAASALAWLLDDGGQAPHIGDDDGGHVLINPAARRDYVSAVSALATAWAEEQPIRGNRLNLGLCSVFSSPQPPAPLFGVRTFPEGGLTVWRRATSEGLLLLAFDHGPLGYGAIAAHGHADALSLWLHWGEEAVLVDPGTYLYHGEGPERDALRATTAHNTLAVGGEEQSRIIGPFAWSDHARVELLSASAEEVVAEHDGYRRRFGLVHRRAVRVSERHILIEDDLLGRAKTGTSAWTLGFTLAPGVAVSFDLEGATLRTPLGRTLHLAAEGPDGSPLAWRLANTPYAPEFGSLAVTKRLELCGPIGAGGRVARTLILLGDHQ